MMSEIVIPDDFDTSLIDPPSPCKWSQRQGVKCGAREQCNHSCDFTGKAVAFKDKR